MCFRVKDKKQGVNPPKQMRAWKVLQIQNSHGIVSLHSDIYHGAEWTPGKIRRAKNGEDDKKFTSQRNGSSEHGIYVYLRRKEAMIEADGIGWKAVVGGGGRPETFPAQRKGLREIRGNVPASEVE